MEASSNMASANPVILVTGASRGIGAAIARHLLLTPIPPLSLVTVSRSPAPSGTIALPDGTLHMHTHVQIDLASPGGPAKAVKQAIDAYGRLDGMVVNHGVLDPVERIAGDEEGGEGGQAVGDGLDGLEEWKKAFDVNFFSVVGLCRSAIPHLRKASGRIVLISSGASQSGYPGWGCYSATKAALNSLCRTLAIEEPNITSIAVRPGVVDTEMQREIREKHKSAMGEEGHKRFLELHRAGKLLRPEQPGAVVANLVVRGERELSGGYFSWDGPELRDYQGTVVPAP